MQNPPLHRPDTSTRELAYHRVDMPSSRDEHHMADTLPPETHRVADAGFLGAQRDDSLPVPLRTPSADRTAPEMDSGALRDCTCELALGSVARAPLSRRFHLRHRHRRRRSRRLRRGWADNPV